VVRQAGEPDLALSDEPVDYGPGFLDRHGVVGVVRLQQVDMVRTEAPQALLEVATDGSG
jgi:hypothetical protein